MQLSLFYVPIHFMQIQVHIHICFWLCVQFTWVSQSCPTLCDPMNRSTPGLPVHHQLPEFTQTWFIESVMPSSHLILCHPLLLLQRIFPTQGSNPGLPHCKQILYQLSHKGSLRMLEWVAYSFASRSSCPRNWTRVSCIAGGFFTSWAIRKAQSFLNGH